VGLLPKGVDQRALVLMVVGAGAPFFLVVAAGMRSTPAADIGVLLSGTMPLFVAILSARIDREHFGRSRVAGFALVVAAMVAIGGPALLAGEGFGFLLIPCGAFLWALYTIAFRRSGLAPLSAAGIVAAWSALFLLPVALLDGRSAVLAADPLILGGQVLSQGILSGVVALVAFGGAVQRLGASRSAIISSLSPVLAALMAVPWLGEVPTPAAILGIALAIVGVTLGSGAAKFGRA
jgi:drug/metabolite transporter (DMT)-like permease